MNRGFFLGRLYHSHIFPYFHNVVNHAGLEHFRLLR
jgi:hypothetical protein